MAINQVKIGNNVIMSVVDTTAEQDKVLPGYFYYDKNGERVEGTCPLNADTSDDDVATNYVRDGIKFHDATGTSQLIGNVTWHDEQSTVTLGGTMPSAQPAAYYSGITYVLEDTTLFIPGNIRKNVTLLGVEGTFEGQIEVETTKYARAATDYTEGGTRYDTISPTEGYDALGNVKVGKIWYELSDTTGTTGKTASIISLTET